MAVRLLQAVFCMIALLCLVSATTGEDNMVTVKDFHKCFSCHTPPTRPDGANVLSVRFIDGVWEIVKSSELGVEVAYHSVTNEWQIKGGAMIDRGGKNITRGVMLKHAKKVDLQLVPFGSEAVVMGNGSKKIVVLDDLDCPFCARLHIELKKFASENPDYSLHILLYPLPGHGKAKEKSEYVLCFKDEYIRQVMIDKFYIDIIEGRSGDTVPDCKDEEAAKNAKKTIEKVVDFAMKVGIRGTPAIILPDGRIIPGYIDRNTLKELLNEEK